MSLNHDAAALLRTAAEGITPETWIQYAASVGKTVEALTDQEKKLAFSSAAMGQPNDGHGRRCALVHLEMASDRKVVRDVAKEAIYDAIGDRYGLAEWQDAEDRTAYDVVELFEQVAARLEAK